MAFLDFVTNRGGQRPAAEQQAQQQKPETAKEMYTRKDAQDRAAQKPIDQMPSDQQAKVEGIKAQMEKATQHRGKDAPAPMAAPTDANSSPAAELQKMSNQEKVAPALSPTSEQLGTPPSGEKAPAKDGQSKPQEKSQETPKPTPRPPSWER